MVNHLRRNISEGRRGSRWGRRNCCKECTQKLMVGERGVQDRSDGPLKIVEYTYFEIAHRHPERVEREFGKSELSGTENGAEVLTLCTKKEK